MVHNSTEGFLLIFCNLILTYFPVLPSRRSGISNSEKLLYIHLIKSIRKLVQYVAVMSASSFSLPTWAIQRLPVSSCRLVPLSLVQSLDPLQCVCVCIISHIYMELIYVLYTQIPCIHCNKCLHRKLILTPDTFAFCHKKIRHLMNIDLFTSRWTI